MSTVGMRSMSCRQEAFDAGLAGDELLQRCDLGPLHGLHREEGRKYPLLIARLLGPVPWWCCARVPGVAAETQ